MSPAELLQHSALTVMDLSTNKLTTLPHVQMKNMMYLYLSNNSLQFIPESVCELPLLSQFGVNGNNLSSIPENIGRLKKTLVNLGASGNNLASFPLSFSLLKHLEKLDIRNNSLAALPPWNDLEKLVHLTVAGNPLCSNRWIALGKSEN